MRSTRSASELRRLWRHEEAFAETFTTAASRAFFVADAAESDNESQTFLDNVVARLVATPRDLLILCEMLHNEVLAREFMRFHVLHDLADHDVIFALAESPAIFALLPGDPAWKEVIVVLYGSSKLRDAGGRKLTLAELAPLGLDVERAAARSVIGSAFDAGLLAEEDRSRLLTLVPNDAYFQAKLKVATE